MRVMTITGMPDPDTRDRVLDAAWRLAEEFGLPAVTVAKVATAAGVSRQAVYLHFGNRATMLLAMATRIDERTGFVARLDELAELPPREALDATLRAWVAHLPTILPVALALSAARGADAEGGAAWTSRMERWWRALRRVVRRLDDAGLLRPDLSVDHATDWVWAVSHPLLVDGLCRDRGWSFEQIAEQVITSVEESLLTADSGDP